MRVYVGLTECVFGSWSWGGEEFGGSQMLHFHKASPFCAECVFNK